MVDGFRQSDLMNLEIGGIIRFHRKRAGMSQKDLSRESGVGKTVIFDIEKNKISIQLKTLLKVCAALGIELKLSSAQMAAYMEHRKAQNPR